MAAKKQVYIFESPYALSNQLLKVWMKSAKEAIYTNACFNTLLSAGNTPKEFYSRLSNIKEFEYWKDTHLFFCNEEFVSQDNEDNHCNVIRNNLINFVEIAQDNVHSISTDFEDPTQAADQYEKELGDYFDLGVDQYPQFDLALLGLGPDGHTASLFPGDESLNESKRLCVDVNLAHLKHKHISVTLPVLNHSKKVIFMAIGEDKADIVQQILQYNIDFPASRVNPIDGELFYFLDKDAARYLSLNQPFSQVDEAITLEI